MAKIVDNRITFSHGTAHFRVQPANAQRVRDQLFALDNAKPRKFRAPKALDTSYPQFKPGMTTAEYLRQFHSLNNSKNWHKVDYVHADRAAPMLDPLTPEVLEEPDPGYVEPTKPAKRAAPSVVATLREKVAALEAEVAALRQQLTADLV